MLLKTSYLSRKFRTHIKLMLREKALVLINNTLIEFGGLIMTKVRLENMIGLLVFVGLLLSGCVEDKTVNWEPSPTFIADNMTFHGTEEKFGIIKANGEGFEPEFPVVGQGRLYHVYFLDSAKDFNGKKYKMMATHKDTGETVKLYEWDIENKQSGAKFGLDKTGLWKIDVSVDDEQYTSFIVEAKSKNK
jgi:hypothetical protein